MHANNLILLCNLVLAFGNTCLCVLFLFCHHSVPPSITASSDGPTDMKVVLSKSLILECEAEGHPPPSLTWLKDGSPVAARENLRVLEQGRKIEILSALPSDAGRYVCVATSVAGEREIIYDVSVLGIMIHIDFFFSALLKFKTSRLTREIKNTKYF